MAPNHYLAPLDYDASGESASWAPHLQGMDHDNDDHDFLEDLNHYRTSGHYPVWLGKSLDNGRYEVVRKLGTGSTANVWLCRDFKSKLSKYVAIKILMATYSNDDFRELRGIELIKSRMGERNARRFHLCLPLRHFRLRGDTDWSDCLVFPVLGPSVEDKLLLHSEDQAQIRRAMVMQVVQAMNALHRHRICHGDFRPANVLQRISGLDGLDEEQVLKKLGGNLLPREVRINPGDNANDRRPPDYRVEPVFWDRVSPKLGTPELYVIDFAQVFPVSDPPWNLGLATSYRPPELLLDQIVGIGADLWTLGCTLFAIRTGRRLFAPQVFRKDMMLYCMVLTLGKLPEPWWTAWKAREKCFEDDLDDIGCPVMVNDSFSRESALHSNSIQSKVASPIFDYPRSIKQALKSRHGSYGHLLGQNTIPQVEIDLFADLLETLLRYDPGTRSAAKSIFHHQWAKRTIGVMVASKKRKPRKPRSW